MQTGVPDEFTEQVRQVLERLFDLPYLYQHPLAAEWRTSDADTAGSRAAALRQAAQEAIEALNPGDSTSFRSPQARLYQLLHLHFVEGLSVQESAHELAISERQAYRDLRRGVETVALSLWHQRERAAKNAAGAADLSSIDAEMERLDVRLSRVDLGQCLVRSARSVERLGRTRGVTLEIAPSPVQVWSYAAAVQQILTSVVSLVVQRAEPGRVRAAATREEEAATVEFRFRRDRETGRLLDHLSPAAATLVGRLGWLMDERPLASDETGLMLQITATGPNVLVIDDNEELLELVARYLSDHTVSVTTASSSEEGLRLARSTRPDAIILDVMMPGMDGWEALQTFKIWPETADIPIVVCSVFHDPELAYSLGASAVLAKPVRRGEVLAALRELGIV